MTILHIASIVIRHEEESTVVDDKQLTLKSFFQSGGHWSQVPNTPKTSTSKTASATDHVVCGISNNSSLF